MVHRQLLRTKARNSYVREMLLFKACGHQLNYATASRVRLSGLWSLEERFKTRARAPTASGSRIGRVVVCRCNHRAESVPIKKVTGNTRPQKLVKQ